MPLKDPQTLSQVGARLRARREEMGMTLEALSAATVIRIRYLVAIERGEADKLPNEATIHGYVRDYADRVGLDASTLLDGIAPAPPAARHAPADGPPVSTFPARHSRHPTRRTWLLGLAAVVIVAILAILHAPPHRAPTAATPPTKTASHSKAQSQPAAAPTPAPVAVRPAGVTGGVVAYRVSGAPTIIMDAHTTGRCWVQVQADGKQVYVGILRSGKTATWHAQRDLRIRVGDFGTIRLTVDGVPLGILNYHSPSTLDFQRVAVAATPAS